jgi:hypothetical protein
MFALGLGLVLIGISITVSAAIFARSAAEDSDREALLTKSVVDDRLFGSTRISTL